MAKMTKQELLTLIFRDRYDPVRDRTYRLTRLRVPGKEICLAHILTPTDMSVYQNLGLMIGVHEGNNPAGSSIGLLRFTPWEAVVVGADCAMKAANVELGFMDRFCGSLILTGPLAEVETAVREVVRFFRDELHFDVCPVHLS